MRKTKSHQPCIRWRLRDPWRFYFRGAKRFAHREGFPARAPWLASTARLLLTRFYPGSFLMLGRVNHLAVELATFFRVIKPW